MIILDLIAAFDFMTDFNGIDRHYPYPFYPSGIYDKDKNVYKQGPPSNEYPILTLPSSLYDKDLNVIPSGFYMVVISDDRKYLNLYQNGELKAKVKIIKLTEEMITNEELKEQSNLLGKIQNAQINKKLKKLRKAQEEYQAFLDKESAKNFAKIEDSGNGYYTLTYYCYGKKAVGIIQK